MNKDSIKKRIIGIDVARALAVVGMIIVNFKIVFGGEGSTWLKAFAQVFEGKAAATFVVLAGVGLALITKSAIETGNREKLSTAKKRIAKRAFLLFLIGLSYIFIWPADILHFYGVYMLIVLLLLNRSERVILFMSTLLICIYPLLMWVWDYETGWNFDSLTYLDFWTIKGFLRNLFYNGFHPVIPWAAFMLFGYWLGKQDLRNEKFVTRLGIYSLLAFIALQVFSYLLINTLSDGSAQTKTELTTVLGTQPMPPLPIYMFSGIAIAFTVISACIWIANRVDNTIIKALTQTGQLALTFYVAHVILGMGLVELIYPGQFGQFSIDFSVGYALGFSLLCILFARIWLNYKKMGPLEWIFRKLTN